MARGGRRSGTPGKAYSNRTDLNPLPKTAVPGQPYGAAKAQLDAQAAVPMQAAPALPQQEDAAPLPIGQMGGLTDDTANPSQPVTHGLPIGAGAGPEVFPTAPDPVLKGLSILNALGDKLPPELRQVARALNISQTNGM